jgi:hypothetical protein
MNYGHVAGAVQRSAKYVLEVEIAFNACSYTELIKLAYNDFERLARSSAPDQTLERHQMAMKILRRIPDE